jgi:transposase InsO family protein
MCELMSISERRACRLAGLSRDAFRHEPVPTPATQVLSARLIELAQVRRRFGYRRLHDLLETEFPNVNHKRIYRLYREAKLSVRRRRKAKRPVGERQKLLAACAPNDTWSMAWTQQHGIEHILIEPGCPTQNGYIESFNGKFRDECLNEHWFTSLAQARDVIADWRRDYNEVRPHSSCGRIPPSQFAANHRAQQDNNAVTFNPGLCQ